ncbi:hypothetical protein AB0L74_22055 [Streptomyces sp. NPDC052020]|uniref:hypothetical protein n=1 Tax=Streptomyces sp. NPDC052020 TaxID=3155677 RepID=UPI00342FDE96
MRTSNRAPTARGGGKPEKSRAGCRLDWFPFVVGVEEADEKPAEHLLLVCGDDTADASGTAPVEPWMEQLGEREAARPPSGAALRGRHL